MLNLILVESIDLIKFVRMALKTPGKEQMYHSKANLSPLASDSSSELDVLSHDGNTLSVDGCEVGVLEQTNQVSLGGLLESQNSA